MVGAGIAWARYVEILAVTGRGVPPAGARVANRADVGDDDDVIGGGPRLRQIALDGLRAVPERETLDVARRGARGRLRRREAEHGDPYIVLGHELPRRRPLRPRGTRGVRDVGREERVFRFAHART